MIRFACPGCNATYTVEDSKGGKAGKCPKCQAQFVIPAAEASAGPPPVSAPEPRRPAPPPPPLPPAADTGAVEIKPCPKCGARLSVAAADLGVDVECPYCQAVYTARRADAPDRPSRRREEPPAEEERPNRRRPRDEDDEDRPSRRRPAADVDDEDRPRRRRRDEDEADEEEDDRPRRRKRRRRDFDPHRGTMLIVLSVLGLCCGILAIASVIMGFVDLAKINRGEMDPDGKTPTIIGIALGFLVILINIGAGVAQVAMKG